MAPTTPTQRTITKFHLDTPYDSPTWPQISPSDQDTILEILSSFLTPIGTHRQNHIIPSKGKRSKKRKRQDEDVTNSHPVPSVPERASQILIGFNSITRHLQTLLVQESCISVKDPRQHPTDGVEREAVKTTKTPYIAAIFTTSPSPTHSILHSHFPLLVNATALSHPDHERIRLVQLPKGCDGRLGAALSLPRVNFIAVMEQAEGSEVLLGLVKEKVGVVAASMGLDVPGKEARYRRVRIVGVEARVGIGRKERRIRETEERESGGGKIVDKGSNGGNGKIGDA